MGTGNTVSIVAIILLVMMSAYFSATETAFTSLNRIKIKNLSNEGNKRAQKVNGLSDRYDDLLSTILIGNNIVNIVITAIATVLFINLYGDVGPTVSTVVITVVILIFGEISPKSLAKDAPERFAMFSQPLISICMVIFKPLNIVFRAWKRFIAKVFKIDAGKGMTDEELKTIVEEAETEGSLEADESELIQNAIEFKELTADEVMTPRVDIKAIDLSMSIEEVGDLFRDTGFSRMPVYDEDMDSILGVLNQKDYHNYIVGTDKTISDFVKPVAFVATSIKIADLLKKLQTMKTHIAIIVDEYGGTEGLVTLEDIIEELVGEIYDEHDAVMSREVSELQNGSYRVMCNASLSKVFDFFEIDEEVGEVNTVNGWVVMELDKLPQKGDAFEYVSGRRIFKCRVTKATQRKALEINIVVSEKPQEDEDN